MSRAKDSLWRQTVKWMKDIPHKLEVLLNNLYTLAESTAMVGVGIYTIFKVTPHLTGYIAIIALVAGSIVTVGGVFRLGKFLLSKEK